MVDPMMGSATGYGGLWSVCFGLDSSGYQSCFTYGSISDLEGEQYHSLILYCNSNISCSRMAWSVVKTDTYRD